MFRQPPHAATRTPDQETRRLAEVRNRLLAVLVVIAIVASLKWSYPVTMPLAGAIFLIGAAWPIKERLDAATPPAFSYIFTLLTLFAIFAAFGWGLWFAAQRAGQALTDRGEQIRDTLDGAADWLQSRGLPTFNGDSGYDMLAQTVQTAAATAYTALGYLGLIAVLVILGLPEAQSFGKRLRDRLDSEERSETFGAMAELAAGFRSYVGVIMITSTLSGGGSALWAWAIGLDLALVWGWLGFIMNFIPVIGNFFAILPPTLYAFVQFGGWTMPLAVAGGLFVVQISVSNFLYPYLQGRGISLPAVTIIIGLSFWGWLWGFAGVVLAVPLTAAALTVCAQFRDTRWVAQLLSRGD